MNTELKRARIWLSCEVCASRVRSDFDGNPPVGWSQFGKSRYRGKGNGFGNYCPEHTPTRKPRGGDMSTELERVRRRVKSLAREGYGNIMDARLADFERLVREDQDKISREDERAKARGKR